MSAVYSNKSSPQPSYNVRPPGPEQHQILHQQAPLTTYAYNDAAVSYPVERDQTQQSHPSPQVSHEQTQSHPAALNESPYPSQPGYHEPISMTLPRIHGSGPAQGNEGEEFSVILTSASDISADARLYKVMFGSKRCSVTIQKQLDAQGYQQYVLYTKIPAVSQTGWYSNKVSVYLIMEDDQGQELSTEEVSQFTYNNSSPLQSYTTSPPLALKKRKFVDTDDARYDNRGIKRAQPALQPDIKPKAEDYVAYSYPSGNVSSYPYTQSSGDNRPYYDQANTSRQQSTSMQPWSNGLYMTGGPPSSQHGVSTTSSQPSQRLATALPSPSDQPPLVRTSTLQQSAYMNPTSQSGGFNPYATYPHKAVLKLQGNLDAMAEQWTEEEWGSRRRLVQFWRQQKSNAIHASFAPVSQSERQSNSICISCIWWAEKNAAFVTSVDCIYLLESLIAVRFTVEEKNRIRRNLEGFHPLTVSKAKPDSENFFKLIMGFPNPKPRNIEKDVKVFPWKILCLALKKIIGKYSASYSSTASVMPSGPGMDKPHDRPTSASGIMGSPHSTASSAPHPDVSGVNSPSLQAQQYHHPQRSPLGRTSPPDISALPVMHQPVSQPPMWHSSQQQTTQHAAHHHQLPQLHHTQPIHHGPRSSWDIPTTGPLDLSTYLEPAGGTLPPGTSTGMSYQRQPLLSPSHTPTSQGRSHMIHNGP